MEKEIRDRYNEKIRLEAMRRYGIGKDEIELLDSFESFIYAFKHGDGREAILRLGHSRRRSPELIRGEVDWINYLSAGGAGVAGALPSESGALVEEMADGRGGTFLATAFEKAQGGSPYSMGGWTDTLIDSYGRLLGRIHRLSKSYVVSEPAWRRPEWDEPVALGRPPLEPAISAKYDTTLAHLRTLPRDAESYGMIHQDAHSGNFFVDENGRITLFDFDDCVFGHFAYDLAMALFYAAANRDDAAEFAPRFWELLLRGYTAEHSLDPAWWQEIPQFMKLREIDLYGVISRDFHSLEGDNWAQGFMIGRKERIENDVPFLDINIW